MREIKQEGGGVRVSFRKVVYEKIGHIPFSFFLQRIFRSTETIFNLISILQQNKHPQMLKMFSRKYFAAKQTEPK